MLQVTPLLLGSFATVAVKSWLPAVRRLAVSGTTETEIGGGAGVSESEPQAARRTKPAPTSDFLGLNSANGDPRLIAGSPSLPMALRRWGSPHRALLIARLERTRSFGDW